MTAYPKEFEVGERTDKVWHGDIVTTCTYLGPLGRGAMHFYDETDKCFRLAYWEFFDGELVLNGWESLNTPFKQVQSSVNY